VRLSIEALDHLAVDAHAEHLPTDLVVLHHQSIGQSINRSINQSVNQSIGQPINWSINQPVNQSNQSVNQSIGQSINQSIGQSINEWTHLRDVVRVHLQAARVKVGGRLGGQRVHVRGPRLRAGRRRRARLQVDGDSAHKTQCTLVLARTSPSMIAPCRIVFSRQIKARPSACKLG